MEAAARHFATRDQMQHHVDDAWQTARSERNDDDEDAEPKVESVLALSKLTAQLDDHNRIGEAIGKNLEDIDEHRVHRALEENMEVIDQQRIQRGITESYVALDAFETDRMRRAFEASIETARMEEEQRLASQPPPQPMNM